MVAATTTKNKQGVSAWLVTWSGTGRGADMEGQIAAVLNPRLSSERVKEIVGLIHATSQYTLGEQIRWMLHPRENPYLPEYERIDTKLEDGQIKTVPWRGRILCGHNPFLVARLVDDLKVKLSADGSEKPLWQDRPRT